MLDKLSVSGFTYHCTHELSLSLPPHHIFLLSQLDCQSCFGFVFSGKKLQNSPLLIACIFHWMWHSHLFFLLTFRLIIHALLYFIWTVIFHFFQWDTELINLLWNLSCHTWLPPSIYICTYICKIMQCGSNFARITAAESCPVWPCSVHRWFTASYKYADIKIQEETVNPMEQGRQETSSDDQRI